MHYVEIFCKPQNSQHLTIFLFGAVKQLGRDFMTKKGIIASVFAIVFAVCLIVIACIFGLRSHDATNPTPVDADKKDTVQEDNTNKEEQTNDNSNDTTKNGEVTDPEITEPEVTDPEVTDPEVTDPEVTDPEVTDPEITDPEVTDPEVTDPETTEPETIDPVVDPTEPEVTEPEEHKLVGDVNLDDKVDFADWVALKEIFANPMDATEQQLLNADVNKDGFITPLDLKVLKLGIDGVVALPSSITEQGGDLNGDGKVNVEDVKYWNDNIDAINQLPQSTKVKFDLDKNGEINSTDYAILRGMLDEVHDGVCSVYFVDNFYGSKNYEQTTVVEGTLVDKFVPSIHSRHIFEGWYVDAKCTTKFDFTKPITTDLVLYGKWVALYYVTFVIDDNKEHNAVVAATVGNTISEITPPTREGYDFDGWFTDKEFKNKFDFNTPLTQDYTLYAKWTKLFTVTYVNAFFTHNGEVMQTTSTTETVKVRDGELAANTILPIRRMENNYGYAKFVGWSTTPIDITDWAPNKKDADKIAKGDVKVKLFDFTTPIKEDKTVYAKWIYFYVDTSNIELSNLVDAIEKSASQPDEQATSVEELYTYDLNKDGKLDAADLAEWINVKNISHSVISGTNTSADVNRDGKVDDKDVFEVAHKVINGAIEGKADVNGDLMIDEHDLASVLKTAGYKVNTISGSVKTVGDINMDGDINSLDGLVLSKFLKGDIGLSDQGILNADVNADGTVNNIDQQVLAMFFRHYIDSLPHAFKGDAVDVNGDGLVNEEDTKAWNAIFEEYKRTIAEMEKRLDINLDGVVNLEDFNRIAEYFHLQVINITDCTLNKDGKIVTLREVLQPVLNLEKAKNFRITVKINDEELVSNMSLDNLNKMIMDLSKYNNGDKVEVKCVYDRDWTGNFWGWVPTDLGTKNFVEVTKCTLVK